VRIAFVSTMQLAPWGGSEALWCAAAEAALADRHCVHLSLSYWPKLAPQVEQLVSCGAELSLRPRQTPGLLRRGLLRCVPAAYTRDAAGDFQPLRRFRPDVVCLSQGWTYEILEYPRLLGFLAEGHVPYLVVNQLADDRLLPETEADRERAARLFGGAREVCFVSRHNLRTTERQLARRLPNATVLYNPVNLDPHTAIPWPSQPVPILASVARLLVRAKGQDVLLESAREALGESEPWELHFFGEGEDRPYLERLARHFGLEDRVRFRGHLPRVEEIWRQSHLLVLPSRGEGAPLALVEAMLAGRPAVVSDAGGNAEWIGEGRSGFIAPAATPAAFAAALQRAWQVRHRWPEMGTAAREEALAKSDPSPGRTLLEQLVAAAEGMPPVTPACRMVAKVRSSA